MSLIFQNLVKGVTINLLSFMESSRCELQPRPSRIPVRHAGSFTGQGLTRALSAEEPMSARGWKLTKPHMKKHLSLTGKETSTMDFASRTMLKKAGRGSLSIGNSSHEATVTSKQESPAGVSRSEPVSAFRKVPLCTEA